jgi:hypothetical protein
LLAYLAGRDARDPGGHSPWITAKRLVLLAGSAAPALIPLGLTALGAPRRLVRLALIAVLGGFALLALAPAPLAAFLDSVTHGRLINLDNIALGWMGPALAAIGVVAIVRAWRSGGGDTPAAPFMSSGAFTRVVVVWLAAECAIAPFISASGSVRRLLGGIVALTLVLARLLQREVAREPARRADVLAIAACGVALGLMFWMVDLDSALAERRTLALVLERTGRPAPDHVVAYVGDHWGGFQYEAPHAGLTMVAADRSALHRGNWLVVPFGVEMRGVELDSTRVTLADSVPLVHRSPITTRQSYYDGRQALRRVNRAWVGARIYRVIADGEVVRRRRVGAQD